MFHTVLHCSCSGSNIKKVQYFILGDPHSHTTYREISVSVACTEIWNNCYFIVVKSARAGACEYGNELSGSIKCGEFLD